jgi:hypothetical protein
MEEGRLSRKSDIFSLEGIFYETLATLEEESDYNTVAGELQTELKNATFSDPDLEPLKLVVG